MKKQQNDLIFINIFICNDCYINLQYKIVQQKLFNKFKNIKAQNTFTSMIMLPSQKYQQNSQQKLLQNTQIIKKQYRNGKFIGSITNNIKNGLGLLILDNNQILFGSWSLDNIQGEVVYLSNQIRLFGKIGNNGVLQGFHVIRVMQSIILQNKSRFTKKEKQQKIIPMTLYANFKNNKIFGKCVIVMKGQIYTCNIITIQSQSSLEIVTKSQNNNRYILQQTLKITFPYISNFQLHSYLMDMIENTAQNQSFTKIISKYEPKIMKYPTNNNSSDFPNNDNKIFYGYSTYQYQRDDKCNQFGFVLYNQEIISIGDHCEGIPNGLAVLYSQERFIHDGIFEYGVPKGIGVRLQFQKTLSKFVYGEFGTGIRFQGKNNQQNVKIYQQGVSWPQKIIKQYRKQIHLKSLHFDSNYAEIGINLPKNQIFRICSEILNSSNNKNNITQNRRRRTQMDLPIFTSSKEINIDDYKTNYNQNKIKTQKRNFGKQTNNSSIFQLKMKKQVNYNKNVNDRNEVADSHQINISHFQQYKPSKINADKQYRSSFRTEVNQDLRNKNRQNRANTVSEILKSFKS